MPLDEIVVEALAYATAQSGQPFTVAKRLIAWLEAMSTRELSAEDESGFLENVRSAIVVKSSGEAS